MYNIDFVHDFLATVNTPTSFPQYTEIKEKYNRRIQRFLNCTKTSEWILFVRSGGTYEEAAELEKILSSMVKHNFQVLLILDGDIEEIKELDWELKHTCVVQFKMYPVRDYIRNKDACTMLFNGITLTS